MPRTRGSEMPQRVSSPRISSLHLKPSRSDSDPIHNRPITERSPKLGDRRSPRGSQSDPLNQKKLSTRIDDLESQLGQAQGELKNLKDQLAAAEAAKREAQEQLEKKTKKPSVPDPVELGQELTERNNQDNLNPQIETDVFEVPMEKIEVEPKVELSSAVVDQESKPESPKKPTFDDLALKDDEIELLKAKVEAREKELQVSREVNASLELKLKEAALQISTSQTKEDEMSLKLSQLEKQLEESKASEVELNEKFQGLEGAKEALETEMKKMRVQTEQWRKAADAAAAVLAGGAEMNGRRISERCGSMDKQIGNMFEGPVGGYVGYAGSPGLGGGDDYDNGFGNGKRRSSGIKMFGDLWKKKSAAK